MSGESKKMIPLFKVHKPRGIGKKLQEVFDSGFLTEGEYSDKFEKQFGEGVDPWHEKAKRYVRKKIKNPYLLHLIFGFIEWLKQKWIDVKVANTMRDIDAQAEEIKKIWEEEDKPKTIITTTPSEVKGLMDMEISLEESIRSIDDAEDINYDDMAGG